MPNKLRRKGLKRELAKLCKKHDIVFMAIFGSYVRGEQGRKSDIDIAIEFKKRSRKSLLDLIEVENELKKLFRRKVDVGIFSSINPLILEDVKKEMIIIYEKR